MLDLDRFLRGFELLCDRFNNGSTKERVTTLYHAILSQHLKNEQFEAAVLISFQHDRYFPSPQELIDKVMNTNHEKALEAWEKVINANPRERFDWDDETGWECLRLVGGMTYIHNCDVEKISFLRREFVAAYESRLGRLAQNPSPDALRLLAEYGQLEETNHQGSEETNGLRVVMYEEKMAKMYEEKGEDKSCKPEKEIKRENGHLRALRVGTQGSSLTRAFSDQSTTTLPMSPAFAMPAQPLSASAAPSTD